jgi:TP901 family phage tail tape measure protein
MTTGVSSFTKTAAASVQRVNTRIDNSFSKLSNLSQLLLGLSVGAIFTTAITDLKNYEDGIASFRTIVSDLNDKEFEAYRKGIGDVAKDTKKSTVDVAMSFEKIAGLNATFAETATGLSTVSKAAIVLSKASKDELGSSTESLVGIMNQFSFGAEEADRVINVLAAGQAVGAASITQTAESFVNFGSVAKGANISLETSVGLIQTLGKYSIFGSEAGNKLKSSITKLQQAGLGYASGQFSINDALAEANAKMAKLSTAKQKDAYITKTFGLENLAAGRILLSNIDTIDSYTKGVTGTTEAQKAAEINSATLSTKIEELKTSFTNLLTTNENTVAGLNIAKNVLGFVADNMDMVVTGALVLIGAYVALKAIVLATNIATFASSVALGIQNAALKRSIFFVEGNVVAKTTDTIVTYAMAAAAWVATTAATAFAIAVNLGLWPILAIIAAIVAIIAIFYYWDEIVAWFSKQWETFTNWIGELWDGLVSWFEEFSFADFFMNIGQSIINFMLQPLKSVLELLALLPGAVGGAAQMGLDKLNEMSNLSVLLGTENEQVSSPEVVNAQNQQSNRMNGNIDINVKDKGNNVDNTSFGGFNGIPVNLTPTQGAF